MTIPYLKQGSKVAIAAPARCITPDEMSFAIQWLEGQGFVPVYDDRLFAVHHIFAGTDDFRAAVFQEYLDNEDLRPFGLLVAATVASVSLTSWISPSFCSIRNGLRASAIARSFTASCNVWAFLRFIRPCLFTLRTKQR